MLHHWCHEGIFCQLIAIVTSRYRICGATPAVYIMKGQRAQLLLLPHHTSTLPNERITYPLHHIAYALITEHLWILPSSSELNVCGSSSPNSDSVTLANSSPTPVVPSAAAEITPTSSLTTKTHPFKAKVFYNIVFNRVILMLFCVRWAILQANFSLRVFLSKMEEN